MPGVNARIEMSTNEIKATRASIGARQASPEHLLTPDSCATQMKSERRASCFAFILAAALPITRLRRPPRKAKVHLFQRPRDAGFCAVRSRLPRSGTRKILRQEKFFYCDLYDIVVKFFVIKRASSLESDCSERISDPFSFGLK